MILYIHSKERDSPAFSGVPVLYFSLEDCRLYLLMSFIIGLEVFLLLSLLIVF